MRSLDNRIDVQVADWRNCGRNRTVECSLSQVRVSLIELLHLPKRSPTQITGPGVAEVGVENSGETSAGVELRGNLACNPLILYKTILTSQFDGIFVVAHGFKITALDARDFSRNQCRAVTEVFAASFGPGIDLPFVRRQCVSIEFLLLGRRAIMMRCPRKRTVEVKIGYREKRCIRPKKPLRPRRGLNSCQIAVSKEESLQFVDPVPTCYD